MGWIPAQGRDHAMTCDSTPFCHPGKASASEAFHPALSHFDLTHRIPALRSTTAGMTGRVEDAEVGVAEKAEVIYVEA